jgi:hypothetical protein
MDKVVTVAAEQTGPDRLVGVGGPTVDVRDQDGALVVAAAAIELVVAVEAVKGVIARSALHVVDAAGLLRGDRSVGIEVGGRADQPVPVLAAVELVEGAAASEDRIGPLAAVYLDGAGGIETSDEVVAAATFGVERRL